MGKRHQFQSNKEYTSEEADRALSYLQNRDAAARRVAEKAAGSGRTEVLTKAEARRAYRKEHGVDPPRVRGIIVPKGSVWTKAEILAEVKRLREEARIDREVMRIKAAAHPKRTVLSARALERARQHREDFKAEVAEALADQRELADAEASVRSAHEAFEDEKAYRKSVRQYHAAATERFRAAFDAQHGKRARVEAEMKAQAESKLLTRFFKSEDRAGFFRACSVEERDVILRATRGGAR